MKAIYLVAALILAACSSSAGRHDVRVADVTPSPVIAAERSFAARALEIGWVAAFREYAAVDGQIVGQAGLVNAQENLAPLEDDGGRDLFWAPAFAGIARSGDLGFTTGPVSFDAERTPAIQYFTVWRRQPDGSWKWIYDGGPGAVAEPGPYLGEGAAPLTLPVASAGVGAAAAAIAQVSAIEDSANNAAALRGHLAGGAHVYRPGQTRAYGGADSVARMVYPSGEVTYRRLRAESSAAGDMVFALGEANWESDGASRQGFFARIWQFQPQGWVIVYDQLIMPRPRPS